MCAQFAPGVIVHVDESPGHALLLESILRTYLRGFCYRYFSNGQQAVGFLETSRVAVSMVMLARQLPYGGCIYALTCLRNNPWLNSAPIVVLDDLNRADGGLPQWSKVDFILPRPPLPYDLLPVFLRLAAPSVLTGLRS